MSGHISLDPFKHNDFFQPQFMNDLLDIKFDSPAWVIEGLVPTQGITIISGAPKSFKSWISLEFALQIAQGQKVFGQYKCEQNNVLIVDEENHLRVIQDRVNKLGTAEDLPISFISQKNFSITNEDHIKGIIRLCNERSVDVIILDSLVRMHDGEENSAKEMAAVFAQIKILCQAGKTVIILHHERKDGGYNSSAQARMRGSSDISAAVDSHISVKKDPHDKTRIIIDHAQCRCAPEQDPFELRLLDNKDNVEFQYLGKIEPEKRELTYEKARETITKILEKHTDGLVQKDLVKEVLNSCDIGDRSTREAIKKLISKDLIEKLPGKKGNEKLLRLKKEPTDL